MKAKCPCGCNGEALPPRFDVSPRVARDRSAYIAEQARRVAVRNDDVDTLFVLDALDELARARRKHPDEEGVLTDAEWLAVLTEEVGECARAIQDETDERLREELVQVAAVAARWARSIPLGRTRPPWAGRS